MTYVVRMTKEANAAVKEGAAWWADRHSAEQAQRWHHALLDRIETLAINPERFAVVPEFKRQGPVVREMPFGVGRRPTHRILFQILPDGIVEVFTIWHGAQQMF